jgi:catechol 2,3-dioxygenase-like lactoylglutathione lyase family enzyme
MANGSAMQALTKPVRHGGSNMRTYLQAKAMAKSLRDSLAGKKISLTHSDCLEMVAQQFGFGNWNVLAAKIALETGMREPRAEPGVSLNQVIPVLRVDSREAARAFYVGVLGFRFDWGDEATALRGFYAQVSRNDLQLHLTTDRPPLAGADVYFRMEGIDGLHREVRAKLDAAHPLAIHDTFYDARELAIEDPFGNRLRFVEINPPGASAQ